MGSEGHPHLQKPVQSQQLPCAYLLHHVVEMLDFIARDEEAILMPIIPFRIQQLQVDRQINFFGLDSASDDFLNG